MESIKFKSTGLVYGNYWGGGAGAYSAKTLEAPTKEALIEAANEGVSNGSLDGGMGYERLKGALLFITKVTTKVIDGKEFVNKETDIEFIGDLTEDEQDFLESCEH